MPYCACTLQFVSPSLYSLSSFPASVDIFFCHFYFLSLNYLPILSCSLYSAFSDGDERTLNDLSRSAAFFCFYFCFYFCFFLFSLSLIVGSAYSGPTTPHLSKCSLKLSSPSACFPLNSSGSSHHLLLFFFLNG